VVQAPVTGATFIGVPGEGAWSVDQDSFTPLSTAAPDGGAVAMVSRSHGTQETDAFLTGFEALHGPTARRAVGSSLKLCEIAAGRAHIYPRFGPTNEWDTAAGDAVLTAAGGRILQADARTPLAYGKPSLLNPAFIAVWNETAELP
jgi:3'(2'), 5'-bisphosphate nucleotidase